MGRQMVAPIPLYCRDNAGSGFLVTNGTSVWLVTCVHSISGLRETPPAFDLFKTAQIHIVGTASVLPLFVQGQQRFSVVTNTTTGNLVDAIAVRLTSLDAGNLISFGRYDIGSIVLAEVGDTITASGFPGLGRMLTSGATKFVPAELQSKVEEIVGVSIRLSNPSVGGLSGGPIVNDKGLVGIMHGDIGASTAMTSALAISLNVIAGQLFQ